MGNYESGSGKAERCNSFYETRTLGDISKVILKEALKEMEATRAELWSNILELILSGRDLKLRITGE